MMSEVWSLNHVAALLMLLAAVATDIKSRSVPNKLIVVFFCLSQMIVIGTAGFTGLWIAMSGLAAAFILGLPFYMMKVFAGGDFKLLLAISPLLSWQTIVIVILTSFVWGAILGIFQVVLKGQLKSFLHNMLAIFLRNKPSATALHAVPYTVAILFGFLSHLSLLQVGWRPL